MLYLNEIVSKVASGKKTVQDLAEGMQITSQEVSVFRTIFGLKHIAVAEDEGLYEFLDDAMEKIVSRPTVHREDIKYILHCHAAPCVSPSGSDIVGRLKRQHGIEHAVSVGLAQDQCATPLTALQLAEILLHAEDDSAKVLILTGEIGFSPRLRVIPNTTIIGDASAACLVGKSGTRNALLAVAQRKFELAGVQPSTGFIPVPATSYGDDLMQVVRDVLAKAALTIDQLSLILIHNVNSISWKFFARNFPCPVELMYMDNVAKNGHCFTSDPFINYCDAVAAGRLKEGDLFLMVSVGTSSTFAAAVLRH